MNWRVAADIGGTFTDLVAIGPAGELRTRKVPSSVGDYGRAIIEGFAALFSDNGFTPAEVEEVLHATTIASNAILEQKGARTGLITTRGFRDVLEIRTLRMPRLYDLRWQKPPPLVPRHLRLGVAERVNFRGEIETPLDEADAIAALQALLAEGVEAIAVCLLHSYANDAHERRIAALAAIHAPGIPLSLSCEVLPEMKEYERTSTTVINSYVGPVMGRYLGALGSDLGAAGIAAPLLLMQSAAG